MNPDLMKLHDDQVHNSDGLPARGVHLSKPAVARRSGLNAHGFKACAATSAVERVLDKIDEINSQDPRNIQARLVISQSLISLRASRLERGKNHLSVDAVTECIVTQLTLLLPMQSVG